MKKPTVPKPSERPTEYGILLIGAVVAVVRQFVNIDPELEANLTNLLVVLVPGITWVVGRVQK